MSSNKQQVEFGDFQTPLGLALEVCQTLKRLGVDPAACIEPTCGRGAFVDASVQVFPRMERAVGVDRNGKHLAAARRKVKDASFMKRDFFRANWQKIVADLPQPLLVIGNPPWVTNSQLSVLGSDNVPTKSNQNLRGMEAVTGRSNFDISEWMVVRMLDWLEGTNGTLAMLCKSKVARRVLEQAWNAERKTGRCSIYRIDAARHFQVTVDACLLVCEFGKRSTKTAAMYSSLQASRTTSRIGLAHVGVAPDGTAVKKVVSDLRSFRANATYTRNLEQAASNPWVWRSGIKHDCSRVMELVSDGNVVRRQSGQLLKLESKFLFPLLKGSQVARGDLQPNRKVVVTQRNTGDDTKRIARQAPKTWRYLVKHAAQLDARRSSIYNNRPRFSIFGVGEYAFAPWKVAIAGLYKKLEFRVVGSYRRKPIMVDDTTYFLPCSSRSVAESIVDALPTQTAQQFLGSQIFWDEKRPITADLLNRLDLEKLLADVGGRGRRPRKQKAK